MGKIDNKKVVRKGDSKPKSFEPLYIKNPIDAHKSLLDLAKKEGKDHTAIIVDFLRGGGKFNPALEQWISVEMETRKLDRRSAIEALLFEAMTLIKYHGPKPS